MFPLYAASHTAFESLSDRNTVFTVWLGGWEEGCYVSGQENCVMQPELHLCRSLDATPCESFYMLRRSKLLNSMEIPRLWGDRFAQQSASSLYSQGNNQQMFCFPPCNRCGCLPFIQGLKKFMGIGISTALCHNRGGTSMFRYVDTNCWQTTEFASCPACEILGSVWPIMVGNKALN